MAEGKIFLTDTTKPKEGRENAYPSRSTIKRGMDNYLNNEVGTAVCMPEEEEKDLFSAWQWA